MKTYDPKNLKVTFKGVELKGFASSFNNDRPLIDIPLENAFTNNGYNKEYSNTEISISLTPTRKGKRALRKWFRQERKAKQVHSINAIDRLLFLMKFPLLWKLYKLIFCKGTKENKKNDMEKR